MARPRKPLPDHGTTARYRSSRDPCRCALCRKAQSDDITAYIKSHPEQRAKCSERQMVRKGTMVRLTGPGQRFYWPGLAGKVPVKFRNRVRSELATARAGAFALLHEK